MTLKLIRELSHPVRLGILREITIQPKTLEKIAEQMGTSAEETSVHLDRLRGAGLVDKEPEGSYRAGPLGQLSLSLLPGLDFVATHADYFRDHELSLLPANLVARIGELTECERTEGSVINIQRAERIIRESKSRIWIVANEVMLDAVPVVRERISEGADFRFVIDQSLKAPDSFEPMMPHLWRQMPRIPAATAVTEKEAILFFPDRMLRLDTTIGFVSTESPFMKWCEDLVDSLWGQGHPLK